MLDSAQAWTAGQQQAGQWMQIDAGVELYVVGVATQARTNCCNQWVTSYRVQTSTDGNSWAYVGGTFSGNGYTNSYQKVTNSFAAVRARYVRIVVQTWSGHISMRAAALTCAQGTS